MSAMMISSADDQRRMRVVGDAGKPDLRIVLMRHISASIQTTPWVAHETRCASARQRRC